MRVKLVQIDGKLPNLALMQLASWHRSRGDDVVYTRDLFGNLVHEARSLDAYMRNLSACASCSHVFDLRDPRHAIVDGHHFCPACNIEAGGKRT